MAHTAYHRTVLRIGNPAHGIQCIIEEMGIDLRLQHFVFRIKEADLGIAMGNAAPATKAVAQVVLVDSKFSHLPDVVARGHALALARLSIRLSSKNWK